MPLLALQGGGPPPPPPGPLALLGTTGTELLQFGLLVAVGLWFLRRQRLDAGRWLAACLALVSIFYLLCPEDSAFQRQAGDGVMRGMALAQTGLMRLGGWNVEADGIAVVGSVRFAYARGCMGLSYLAMGLICMAAYPGSWSRRGAGLAVMASGMISLNLVRLIALYQLWAGGLAREYDLFHRAGGGVFAAGAAALFGAVLAAGVKRDELPRTALQPSTS